MANENEIVLPIEIDTKGATSDLKKFEDQVSGSIGSIEKSLEAFKLIAGAVVVGLGLEKLGDAFKDVVHEASEADQTLRSLGVALAGTGEFSDAQVERFKKLADSIEATTTVTDDAVLKGVTLAKSFGITNDQAEKLVKTAVDLSAATGTDLNTAVEQLGATFSGTAGRLAKTTPQLKGLSEEALKNGDAIDLLAAKYKGFAEASTQTFSGALTQTGNAFDQILKGIGQVITQNPVIIEAIKFTGEIFKKLSDIVNNNQEAITIFISKALKGLVSFLPTVIKGFVGVVSIVQALIEVMDIAIRAVLSIGSVFLEITKPIRDFENVIVNGVIGSISLLLGSVLDIANSIPGVGKAIASLGIDVDGLQDTLDEFGTDRLNKAFTLDTSASDSFQKFANESLDAVNEFSAQSKERINGFLDTVGDATANLIPQAEAVVARFDKLGNSLTGVTKGIKNVNSGLGDMADITKRLEALKGSFDKVKGAVEPLQLEIDKLTLSQNALIDAEFERNAKNLSNAAEELALQGKLKGNNLDLINQYAKLIVKKQELAKQKLTIGDFTVSEFVDAFSTEINKLQDAFDGFKAGDIVDAFSGVGDALNPDSLISGAEEFSVIIKDGFAVAVESAAESFGKITIGELADGFGDFVVGFGQEFGDIVGGIISGQFVTQALNVLQSFSQFPDTVLKIFTTAGSTFSDIAAALPEVIDSFISQIPQITKNIVSSFGVIVDELVKALPKIGETLANSIGDILVKLAEKLPDIVDGLIKALEPLIAKIFQDVLPALIRALPGVVTALANAIAPILTDILKALPTIIQELVKAFPLIVRAIVDALPDIAIALAENIGPVVEAFAEGLITLMPDIAIALVDSLITKGGIFKIALALVKAVPQIAEALVVGVVRGLGQAALSIGQAMGRGIVTLLDNFGGKLGGDFVQKVSGAFSGFAAQIGSAFTLGASVIFASLTAGASAIFGSLSTAFAGAFTGLFATVQASFNSIFGNLFATIQGAFSSVLGSVYGTIVDAFNSIFGNLGATIRNAGKDLANLFQGPVNDLKGFLNKFKFPDINIPGVTGGGNGNIHVLGVDTGVKFADGGQVSKVPTGFPNDSFHSSLQSNELVVDQGLTLQLERFLNNGNASASQGPDLSTAILAKILSAVQDPQQVTTQIVLNGRELANAILDLQRNNSRLSA